MAFAENLAKILKVAFYAGFKCTNSTFNGELPYIEKEHFEDISCSDQIDNDPSVNAEFESFFTNEILPNL